MQTRQQKQALMAYQHVTSIKTQSWNKDYGRLCLNFPALLYSCGLCQAIAFYQSKSAKPFFAKFLEHLAEAIGVTEWAQIREADIIQYQRLTMEALNAASWYKRYAEAILKVESGNDEAGGQQ